MQIHSLLHPESLLAALVPPGTTTFIVRAICSLPSSPPKTQPSTVTVAGVLPGMPTSLRVRVQLVLVRTTVAEFKIHEHGRVCSEAACAAHALDL